MRDFVNFMKELFMLKKYDDTMVGLSGFKKAQQVPPAIVRPGNSKDIKLSDLMRRA